MFRIKGGGISAPFRLFKQSLKKMNAAVLKSRAYCQLPGPPKMMEVFYGG
jgi:hypothetical protein